MKNLLNEINSWWTLQKKGPVNLFKRVIETTQNKAQIKRGLKKLLEHQWYMEQYQVV